MFCKFFTANILYNPLSQAAFESSAVSKEENALTVNQLARQLLPLKVTNNEIDSGLKRVSGNGYEKLVNGTVTFDHCTVDIKLLTLKLSIFESNNNKIIQAKLTTKHINTK